MDVIFGLMTLINNEIKGEVIELWDYLESAYNLKEVKAFTHPNISFTGGICDDIFELISKLDSLVCPKMFRFEVSGVEKFESPENTIFLKVSKSRELIELHKRIFTILTEAKLKTFNLYNTENWIPHITLATKDVSYTNVNEIYEDLKSKQLSFSKGLVDNLALVTLNLNSGEYKIIKVWNLF